MIFDDVNKILKSNLKLGLKRVMGFVPYQIWRIREKEILSNPDWISYLSRVYSRLIRILPNYPFVYFFSEYAKLIISISSDKDKKGHIRNNLLRRFYKRPYHEKMFIHCALTACRLLDDKAVRIIMKDVILTDNLGYRYWLGMDISYTTFGVGKGIYSNFYHDRRKVFEKIAKESDLKIPIKIKTEQKNKICILTYQLNSNMHNSVQRVCAMLANNLSPYADNVMVLCVDSTYKIRTEGRKYITLIRTPKSYTNRKTIKMRFNNEIDIKYANGNNYLERMQDCINILYSYNPRYVIDITDEFSPLSYIYAKDFFTVYFPLRAGVSCQYFSKMVTAPNKFTIINSRYNNVINKSKVIYWTFPEYIPDTIGDMTKADLGIDKDSFVVITIGNNGVIDDEIVDSMKALLESDNAYVWLLVGYPPPYYLLTKCQELIKNRRVINWGYENNLLGICAACDVVLRQDMTGGSGGTAIAAMKGLPIVMTSKVCDASRWLGLNYSDISDTNGLINEIKKLKNDSEYYAQRKKQILNLVSKVVDSKEKWNELFDLIIKARECVNDQHKD